MSGSEPAGLAAGLRASVNAEVTPADTAAALGSGDLPVLGTPRLLALAEAASVAALAGRIGAAQTTVGAAVSLEHSRPTPVGGAIEVEAELAEVDGRRLRFNFVAYGRESGAGRDAGVGAVIGAGTLDRVIVDRDSFLARAGRSR